MGLDLIRRTLESYDPASIKSKDLKAALKVIIFSEPQPPDEECLEILREDIQVESLYNDDILNGPTVLFRVLRDYLVLIGVTYKRHEDSNKLSYGIANTFFENEDQEYALSKLRTLSGNKSNIEEVTNTNNQATEFIIKDNEDKEDKERKVAMSISQTYKNKSDRFTGKLGEDIHQFFRDYNTTCNDYKVSKLQKFKYVHYIFDEEAKHFFNSISFENNATYEDAVQEMTRHFDTNAKQTRVRQYLQSLTLTETMQKNSCDVSEGLEILRNTISKFAPQGPHAHRTDEAKIEYMYNTVIEHPWASAVLNTCYADDNDLTFNKLCNALDSAWLQEQNKKKQVQQFNTNANNSETNIFWESQRFYGRPPKNRKYRHRRAPRCYNCNEKGHYSSQCPKKEGHMTRNVHEAIKRNPKKAKKILFELCQQYDTYHNHKNPDGNEAEKSTSESDSEIEETNTANFLQELNQSKDNYESDSSDF